MAQQFAQPAEDRGVGLPQAVDVLMAGADQQRLPADGPRHVVVVQGVADEQGAPGRCAEPLLEHQGLGGLAGGLVVAQPHDMLEMPAQALGLQGLEQHVTMRGGHDGDADAGIARRLQYLEHPIVQRTLRDIRIEVLQVVFDDLREGRALQIEPQGGVEIGNRKVEQRPVTNGIDGRHRIALATAIDRADRQGDVVDQGAVPVEYQVFDPREVQSIIDHGRVFSARRALRAMREAIAGVYSLLGSITRLVTPIWVSRARRLFAETWPRPAPYQ